jgi:hypothetical protein
MDSVRVATGQSPILTSYLNAASVFFVTSFAKLHSLALFFYEYLKLALEYVFT